MPFANVSQSRLLLFGILFALTFICCQSPAGTSRIILPAIFADNMILQRDQPINIWGQATPGLKVTVTIANQSASTIPGADGSWSVKLPALPAGEHNTLKVYGGDHLVFRNVALGDVWFCAGQSNIAWIIKDSFHAPKDIDTSTQGDLRFFQIFPRGIPNPQISYNKWQTPDAKNVEHFSAVPYFSAEKLLPPQKPLSASSNVFLAGPYNFG